ncbi:MAG: general secretion pathway protein GspC, partial [Polyangiaceae bacterium]|nr:general secretion pathway protein GspC [Polyangiaceae bacterium]
HGVTESDDPLWSFAMISSSGEKDAKLSRVGDRVGNQQVAYIGYNPSTGVPAVWLEGDTLCQAPLFGVEPAPAAAGKSAQKEKKPPIKGKKKSKSRELDPEIAAKIKKISDTEFEVDRSAIDKILNNQATLMRSARIVPESEGGKVLGIRLFGVRPKTLLGTLGLKNGDRLETINGFNMGSPEKALEAYARLRTASNLALTLNRRGKPMTINLRIK